MLEKKKEKKKKREKDRIFPVETSVSREKQDKQRNLRATGETGPNSKTAAVENVDNSTMFSYGFRFLPFLIVFRAMRLGGN